MSYPENPLDKFRTYSYHHILMAAVTTECLRPFMSASPDEDTRSLSAVLSTVPGDPIKVEDTTDENAPYLILDSRRTSGIAIREVTYSTTPGVGSPNQTHIINGEVNVTITDADGIVFINFLEYLMDVKFKSNYYGVTFLLKTIFVGHSDTGGVDSIINVASMPLILSDMTIDVTSKEGVYALKFVPSSHNVAMLDKLNCMSEVKSIKSADGKLGTTIKNFENRVNKAQRDLYKKMEIHHKKQGDEGSVQLKTKIGRLIQYMITIPEKWEEFVLDQQGKAQSFERNWTNALKQREQEQLEKYNKDKAAHEEQQKKQREEQRQKGLNPGNIKTNERFASFQPNITIYDTLSLLLRMCDSLNALANVAARNKKELVIYKTLTSVTSNTEVMVIHYDVVTYTVPNINVTKEQAEEQWIRRDKNNRIIPFNSLEFDYIFSGKNSDIIDLSIKTTTAQMLLATDSKASTDAKRYVQNQKSQPEEQEISKKVNIITARENSPVLPQPKTIDQQTNYAGHTEQTSSDEQRAHRRNRDEWAAAVANIHGMSNTNLRFSIRGNPNLLNKYVISYLPKHVVDNKVKLAEVSSSETFVDNNIVGSDTLWQSNKADYRKKLDDYLNDTVFKDMNQTAADFDSATINGPKAFKFPFFVKVNIFAPNRVELGSFSNMLKNSNNMYTQFWYNGWYFVQAIDNKFIDGSFTQEMLVTAYELFGEETQSNEEPKPVKPTDEQEIEQNVAAGKKYQQIQDEKSRQQAFHSLPAGAKTRAHMGPTPMAGMDKSVERYVKEQEASLEKLRANKQRAKAAANNVPNVDDALTGTVYDN